MILLDDDFLVDRVTALPILGKNNTEILYTEDVLPCTLGELKEMGGTLISSLKYVLTRCVFIDDDSEDFVFERQPEKLARECVLSGVPEVTASLIPHYMRVIFEEYGGKPHIRVDAHKAISRAGAAINEISYYFEVDENGEHLLTESIHNKPGKYTASRYIYLDGVYVATVTDILDKDKRIVEYRAPYEGSIDVVEKTAFHAEVWHRLFGDQRESVLPEQVSAVKNKDILYAETARYNAALPGRHIISLHQYDGERNTRYGKVVKYLIMNGERPETVMEDVFSPMVYTYERDEEGNLIAMQWGNGDRVVYRRTYDGDVTTSLSFEKTSYKYSQEAQLTREVLFSL